MRDFKNAEKAKEVLERMNKFSEMMFEVYEAAEGLRDCTESGAEKEVFNKTRNALYELKYEARKLFYKWSDELKKRNITI